jgi:hypothetical protein
VDPWTRPDGVDRRAQLRSKHCAATATIREVVAEAACRLDYRAERDYDRLSVPHDFARSEARRAARKVSRVAQRAAEAEARAKAKAHLAAKNALATATALLPPPTGASAKLAIPCETPHAIRRSQHTGDVRLKRTVRAARRAGQALARPHAGPTLPAGAGGAGQPALRAKRRRRAPRRLPVRYNPDTPRMLAAASCMGSVRSETSHRGRPGLCRTFGQFRSLFEGLPARLAGRPLGVLALDVAGDADAVLKPLLAQLRKGSAAAGLAAEGGEVLRAARFVCCCAAPASHAALLEELAATAVAARLKGALARALVRADEDTKPTPEPEPELELEPTPEPEPRRSNLAMRSSPPVAVPTGYYPCSEPLALMGRGAWPEPAAGAAAVALLAREGP